jgi:hypothetical protein
MKNFETLEVGKTYRDRLGNLVKITGTDNHHTYPFDGDNGVSYMLNGFEDGSTIPSPNDLIELVEIKRVQPNPEPEAEQA